MKLLRVDELKISVVLIWEKRRRHDPNVQEYELLKILFKANAIIFHIFFRVHFIQVITHIIPNTAGLWSSQYRVHVGNVQTQNIPNQRRMLEHAQYLSFIICHPASECLNILCEYEKWTLVGGFLNLPCPYHRPLNCLSRQSIFSMRI